MDNFATAMEHVIRRRGIRVDRRQMTRNGNIEAVMSCYSTCTRANPEKEAYCIE
jgi:hypothetical protein